MMNWRDWSRSERRDFKNVINDGKIIILSIFIIFQDSADQIELSTVMQTACMSRPLQVKFHRNIGNWVLNVPVLCRFQQKRKKVDQKSGCSWDPNDPHLPLDDAARSSSEFPLSFPSVLSWKPPGPARPADRQLPSPVTTRTESCRGWTLSNQAMAETSHSESELDPHLLEVFPGLCELESYQALQTGL